MVTEAQALAALKDVHDNDGFMWRPATGTDAVPLWADLRKRGWVSGNTITPAGRSILDGGREP